MSSPSAHSFPETITPTNRARDSLVITHLHDDPYMLVRQAYTPIAMDIESEPFKDPIETEETYPLCPRVIPLPPDYTPASLDYTLDTLHLDKDLEPMEASETRPASPSGSTSPLSPDHPLTQTSPTSTPSQAFYYHSTAYRSSYENPSSSASPASSLTLPIQKRYQGTFELILYTKTEGDELEAKGTGSESEESEDESADEPLGLGYGAARRRALELVDGPAPSTFEVGQSSKTVPDQQTGNEITTLRLLVCATWEDPVDASLTIPSPVALPVTTRAASITLEEDEFLEAWEPGTSTGAGHYQFRCLMATNLGPRGLEKIDRRPKSGSIGLRERVATLEQRMDRAESYEILPITREQELFMMESELFQLVKGWRQGTVAGEGHMARQCPMPKRRRDATWFRDKVILVEAQGNGKVLNEEELEFLVDPGITKGPVTQKFLKHNAAYQAGDLDAYDFDCDDFSTSKEKEAKNINTEIALEKKVKELDNIKAQQIRLMVYDGSVIAKETNVISIAGAEETLMLEEESRSKMILKQNFGKHFVPQQELFDEQALHPNTDQSASLPVKIKAPRELPKKRITPNALTEGEWGFEHTKAIFQKEIIPFLKTLKDIFNVFDKDLLNEVIDVQTVFNQMEAVVQKFKGKDIVGNAAHASNATTIAPEMYKLDLVTLAPKDKNNRETHIYYLKHIMEQAAILKEIVEQSKSLYPLDSASYSACNSMFDARHELCFLEFVSDMNASSKSKSVKETKKKEEWKPTGKVITATNKVPLREPVPLEVIAQESVVTKVYTRRPMVPKTNGSNSKPKIAKSMISNKMEPGTSWGSNTSVAPSSSSFVDLRLSKSSYGIWTPDAPST
ncbi:hypothetical protein Tco_1507939 [Tanacetum coccineum]